MDDQTRRWIEDDIARLVVEYARLLDFGDRDGWLRLFPADGVLDLGFMRSSGQQELRQFLEGRSPRYTTAHVVSNIWVQVQDEDNATGTNYMRPARSRWTRRC
jgi:3-phenylpropionate/cinnamic acid dioxygenase small subunit